MTTAASRSDAAETEIFDFDILINAVFGSFPAEAGFLYAPEGCDFRGNDSCVDADDTVLESLSDSPDTRDIAAVEISRQTKFRIIGEGNGVSFRLKSEKRSHGTKR